MSVFTVLLFVSGCASISSLVPFFSSALGNPTSCSHLVINVFTLVVYFLSRSDYRPASLSEIGSLEDNMQFSRNDEYI